MKVDPDLVIYTGSPWSFNSRFAWAKATEKSSKREVLGRVYLKPDEYEIDHFTSPMIGMVRAYPPALVENITFLTKQEIFKYTMQGKI